MQCSRSLAAFPLLLLLSCGGSSAAGGAEEPSSGGAGEEGAGEPAKAQSDEKRLIELFESLAGDLRGAKDCAKYASGLDGWLSAHADEVRTLTDRVDSQRQELKEEDVALYDRQLVDAIEVVLIGADECVEHDQAQAAFDAFDELLLGS